MAYATPLSAYLDQRAANEKESLGNIQQASGLQELLAKAGASQRDAKAREIMASSASPEDKFTALAAISPEHAKQFASGLKEMQAMKMNQVVQNAFNGGATATPTSDPAKLRATALALIAANHPGGAPLLAEAQRREVDLVNAQTLERMKGTATPIPAGTPVPGTNTATVQPIPPEDQAAFQKVALATAAGQTASATPQPGDQPTNRVNATLAPMMEDPTFGPRAKALNDAISTAHPRLATHLEGEVERLSREYTSSKLQRNVGRVPAGYRMNSDGSLERIPVAGATKTSDDALTNDAWYTIINGKSRPGSLPIGRDEGNRYREQLREKTAQIATSLGMSPERLATLGPENKAKFGALAVVEKDLAAIRPFDDMLNTNAKIALDLAKKISSDRTNSQLLNKPITWLENNAMDNPDIAEYLFQIQTVKTEGARILNNPRLVGQLSDSARTEMAGVVNGNMPLGQTTRVLERMMADGKNRVSAIERESERLRADIRGSAGGVTPPPTTPTPIAAPTAPAPTGAAYSDPDKERRYQEWKRSQGK